VRIILKAHGVLFRPAGPLRLAVITYASSQNRLRRAQMPQLRYHRVDFRVLGMTGRAGHWLIASDTGIELAAAELEQALERGAKRR